MYWHICSQTASTGKIVLKEDIKTYFIAKKTCSANNLHCLEQGGSEYEGGNNLRVEFIINTTYETQIYKVADVILDKQCNNVGFVYNFFVEDGIDNDFNDYYVNIVAWNKQG